MCPDLDMHIKVNNYYLPFYLKYDNPDDLDQCDPELTLYSQFSKVAMQLADNAETRDGIATTVKRLDTSGKSASSP